MMRDLFKSDFMYDVMMKPSNIEKGRGVRYNGADYIFISSKIHSFGALEGEGMMIKKNLRIYNIFTGEEEIYLVNGTSEGFEYIN